MTRRGIARRWRVAGLAGVLALTLSACGSGLGSTGDKGYVDGLGVVTVVPPGNRTAPGPVSGPTLTGSHLSLSAYRGKIVVVNVWGSWCPPCRAETPFLEGVARRTAKQGVVFVGIDTRDLSRAQPLAFVRTHHVSYPSIFDPDGHTLLAFDNNLPPSAIPSTVVLDRQGRVAASMLGPFNNEATLLHLIAEARK